MKMMVKSSENNIVRCSIVGDGLVGKTSLVEKFIHKKHSETYEATVFDNFAGHVAVAGNKYTVSVYDTAGQYDYEGLRAFSYAQSDVTIVCYSAVDRDSYNNVTNFWIPEIRKYVTKNKPIILVATQKDLCVNGTDEVSTHEGDVLAEKIGAALFVECSVNDMDEIEELFQGVVKNAVKKIRKKVGIFEKLLRRCETHFRKYPIIFRRC